MFVDYILYMTMVSPKTSKTSNVVVLMPVVLCCSVDACNLAEENINTVINYRLFMFQFI